MPCDDAGSEGVDACSRQGTLKNPSKPPEAGGEASLTASEGTDPATTLISDLFPPELYLIAILLKRI